MYSVTASAAAGVLTVIGDDNANVITVSRDLAGNLRIDSGAVAINGSPATVANIQSIRVSALGGNDNVKLDETNGALPPASLSGGNGNDTLTGGSGADTLNGDDGDDVLLGKAGNDLLFGGNGNDTLTGGAGIDRDFGQAGNDRMIWNGGDGSDLNEGGDGSDTVEVNGGDASESFRVGNVLGRVHFERVDPAPFTLDIGTTEKVVLNANGGDDTFSGGTNLAALTSFVVNGGVGKDTLLGTDGADTLNGGDGKDFVDGNAGKDVALLGSGDDTFQWDPGDGSDVVEGQTGTDLLLFNGAPAAENMALSNNAGRLLLTRDLGTISMDVNGVESVQINALAGVDNITVHNLAGTAVKQLNLNLEGIPGKGAPDGQTDSVLVEGTNGDDVVTVAGRAGGDVSVTGLAATVTLRSADPTDKLSVHARGGNDAVIASGLDPTAMLFSADGGSGNDLLIGSAGNDTLTGGDGDDFLLGGAGTDQLDGGAGHNVLIQ